MALTTVSDTIVIVDDELNNVVWLLDFLNSRGYKVITATNVNSALEILEKEIYRAIIVDLNIPVLEPIHDIITSRGDIYARYPGLFIAYSARNKGYRGRQVVVYSVHKDKAVEEEVRKLSCEYILKGRPKEIKEEIESILSFDPSEPRSVTS